MKFDEYRVNTTKEQLITDLITQVGSAIYDFHFQFDEIFNAINMRKPGILSPQIIDHVLFIESYKKALGHHVYNTALEPKYKNYQFILHVWRLMVFTVKSKVFFKITIPLLTDLAWDIIRVYSIPTKIGHAFLAPVIEHSIFLMHQFAYMNIDNEYLDKNCNTKIGITICKQTQATHDKRPVHDCASEIINFSRKMFANLLFIKSKI